ncbi:MAG: AAA family ATPase [Candidatus Micrarchaeales archaeon]|jgi:broad-specificity NMP kinase|nr:AAA family ATPase [Candidatus Micrarchaeales archaeon]
MKLVLIYGPPGVGKLTVASKLAKMTDYKLFHNHLSIEFVKSIFEFGSKTFNRLVIKFRYEMLENAAKDGINTIFTLVYRKDYDDKYIRKLTRIIESHGGEMVFVRLYCSDKKLLERIKSRNRSKYSKIKNPEKFKELISKNDLKSAISFVKSLAIDTGRHTPEESARKIKEYIRSMDGKSY